MAIMKAQKNLYFGDINLADYGVYISGAAVYNAPERDVEYVSIPGRNGDYALDRGRFNNIEVTYPAGVFDYDQADFADKMAELRSALASQTGYQRITDEYNPNEYRLGVYAGGIEVDAVANSTAGEFEIRFVCKPQRWLTSGETAVTVASGDVLTNPTLFDANPMIMIDGYGEMTVNGYEISVDGSELIGRVDLGVRSGEVARIDLSNAPLNTGDTITVTGLSSRVDYLLEYGSGVRIASVTISVPSDLLPNDFPGATYTENHTNVSGNITFGFNDALTFQNGTAKTYEVMPVVTFNLTNSTSFNPTYRIQLKYDGANTITFSTTLIRAVLTITERSSTISSAVATSTKSILGAPIYIDCEIGECYKIENGTYVSLNKYISLGSDLPVLSPGNNSITFDNTYNSVQVAPRWWRV